MTTYKELAEHLEAYFKNAHRMDEVISILRSLDAQRPFEIDWPEYHSSAMGCGLEDRDITDRYEAMYYGWCQGCAMRPAIAQAIHDAAVSDRAEYLDTVADRILSDVFMPFLNWCTAYNSREHGFPGWLRTDEGRTYMLLVAEALS